MRNSAILSGAVLIATALSFSLFPPGRGAAEGEARTLSVKVTNEAGEPLEMVKWLVSATEIWRDGRWAVIHQGGAPMQGYTDKDGRFELTFRGKARYDLQISGGGYAPVFLYQLSPEPPELHVVMKEGIVVRGTVVRAGSKRPCSDAAVVNLRLPNSRGVWFQQTSLIDHEGKFRFIACPPPDPAVTPDLDEPITWQLVCAEEVVPIDIAEGKPVDWVEFEIDVKVTWRPAEGVD